MGKKKILSTKVIVTAALMVAVSIILTRFCVIYLSNSVRISFGNIPIIISGILFGPLVGALVGAVSDILGAAFLSSFGYYPPLTITPIIMGVIPALFRTFLAGNKSYYKILLVVLAADVLGPMCWSTYWLSKLYGTPVLALLPIRVPLYIGIAIAESIVIFLLFKSGVFKKYSSFPLGDDKK